MALLGKALIMLVVSFIITLLLAALLHIGPAEGSVLWVLVLAAMTVSSVILAKRRA